jgi:hypothetical protein
MTRQRHGCVICMLAAAKSRTDTRCAARIHRAITGSSASPAKIPPGRSLTARGDCPSELLPQWISLRENYFFQISAGSITLLNL